MIRKWIRAGIDLVRAHWSETTPTEHELAVQARNIVFVRSGFDEQTCSRALIIAAAGAAHDSDMPQELFVDAMIDAYVDECEPPSVAIITTAQIDDDGEPSFS